MRDVQKDIEELRVQFNQIQDEETYTGKQVRDLGLKFISVLEGAITGLLNAPKGR